MRDIQYRAMKESDVASQDIRDIGAGSVNRTTVQDAAQSVDKRMEEHAGAPVAAVVGGSIGGLVVLCLVFTTVILILRRRKKRNFNYNDVTDHQCHSAPLSRQASPLPTKRVSCPDLRRDRQGSAIARSLTAHNIPDFTLPPERVQPNSPQTSTAGIYSPLRNQQYMLGTVQPELYVQYPYSEDNEDRLPLSQHGWLWFSLIYDAAVEQLSVTVIKAKQLTTRDKGCGMRDPFMKLFLLPDERTCRISKVRRKTLAPMFNETFVFQMQPDDINKRTLRMSVYDVDKRRIRHCLGHVLVSLKEVDLTKGDTLLRELVTNGHTSASLGDLQFSLTYLSNLTKLKVVLMRCRNLRQCDYEQDSGLFIQVQLLHGRKVVKTKKTSVQHESCDPAVNESFTFSLNGQRLDTCSLLLKLRTIGGKTCRIGKSQEYGRVVVGPFMFARGEQLIHWQDMLGSPSTAITRWHALSPPPSHY